MAQKFTTNCEFGGKKIPVTLYIGNPAPNLHPLAFQGKWLNKEKGGNIPNGIMQSFEKLKNIADGSKLSFEELCKYVVEELNSSGALEKDFNKASQLSQPKSTDQNK